MKMILEITIKYYMKILIKLTQIIANIYLIKALMSQKTKIFLI